MLILIPKNDALECPPILKLRLRERENMWDFPVGRLKREKLGIRFKRKRKARIGICLEEREVRDI